MGSVDGDVYVSFRSRGLDAVVHSRVPFEVKVWLEDLALKSGLTVSQIIRSILISAYTGSLHQPTHVGGKNHQTIIVNMNIARAESKIQSKSTVEMVNVDEYLKLKALDRLIVEARRLIIKAEEERKTYGAISPSIMEASEKLNRRIAYTLENMKRIPREKLWEIEQIMEKLNTAT